MSSPLHVPLSWSSVLMRKIPRLHSHSKSIWQDWSKYSLKQFVLQLSLNPAGISFLLLCGFVCVCVYLYVRVKLKKKQKKKNSCFPSPCDSSTTFWRKRPELISCYAFFLGKYPGAWKWYAEYSAPLFSCACQQQAWEWPTWSYKLLSKGQQATQQMGICQRKRDISGHTTLGI